MTIKRVGPSSCAKIAGFDLRCYWACVWGTILLARFARGDFFKHSERAGTEPSPADNRWDYWHRRRRCLPDRLRPNGVRIRMDWGLALQFSRVQGRWDRNRSEIASVKAEAGDSDSVSEVARSKKEVSRDTRRAVPGENTRTIYVDKHMLSDVYSECGIRVRNHC